MSIDERFAADGVVEIRDFLSGANASELRSTVNDIYDVVSADTDLGNGAFAQNFNDWKGIWLKQLPSYLSARNQKLAAELSNSLDYIDSETRRTFGSKWEFVPDLSFFRRHIGMVKKLPWHIDADAATVARVARNSINVWLPLDDVGASLPSIEVVSGSAAVMRKIPMLTGDDRSRDDAFVSSIGGRPSVPVLKKGDALVFDQYTLHRTQQIDGTFVRTSCEFRFVKNRTLASKARKFMARLSA